MSFHDPLSPDGARAVGAFALLPETERLLVWSVRRWLGEPDDRAEVWNAFATGLGTERGRRALRAFEAYLAAVATGTTRRLCRHAASCPCVGRDEADLAGIVALAARDGRAAATDRAARLVAPGHVPAVVDAAGTLGRLLAGCPAPRMEGPAARGGAFRVLH